MRLGVGQNLEPAVKHYRPARRAGGDRLLDIGREGRRVVGCDAFFRHVAASSFV